MIPLILTVFCSTGIALLLKYNDTRGGNAIVLLAGNYFVAALVSLFYLLTGPDDYYSHYTLIFGALLGLFFVLTFFAFARAVSVAGTALATVSSRLSVVVPLTMSVIIFNENPSIYQMTGFLVTAGTIYLFYLSLRSGKSAQLKLRGYLYLLTILIGIGINDFCIKLFQVWRPVSERPFFLFMIFTSACLLSVSYVIGRGIKPEARTILTGFVLGVPNVYSTVFLLAALSQLAAIIVYPVVNIGIILLTSLLAMLLWRDRLNKFGLLALFSGIIAIFLLSL